MQAAARGNASSDFEHYLGTGRRRAPLEVKFNPNHNPANGRFASGPGGGRIATPNREAHAGRTESGPFREAARREDDLGTTARAVNAFVGGKSSRLDLPLGGAQGHVFVERVNGSELTLDHPLFSAMGRITQTRGLEEVRIHVTEPKLKLAALGKLVSFPSEVRIFQAVSGNINFGLDKDVELDIPFVGRTKPIKRGLFVFAKSRQK